MPDKVGYAATAAPEKKTLKTDEVMPRLAAAVEDSYRKWDKARATRRELLRMYAGSHYGEDDGKRVEFPINLMHRAMAVTASSLTASDPVAECQPMTISALRGYSMLLEKHLTYLLKQVNFREIERLVLLDAMTMLGVTKVGLAPTGGMIEVGDQKIDPGFPYVCRISPDDYILDSSCRHRDERMFEGHRYRTTRDRLRGVISDDLIDQLPEWCQRRAADEAAGLGGERRGDEFVQFYDLIDLYIPPGVLGREAFTVTLPGDPVNVGRLMKDGKGLMTVGEMREYEGPQGGPYCVMGFSDVPDNPLPTPWAGFLLPLAKMVNSLGVHIMDADSSQASFVAIQKDSQSAQTIDWLKRVPPNGMIEVEDLTGIQQMTKGGSSEKALASLGMYMELFNKEAGNADMMSGNLTQRGNADVTATEVATISQHLNARLDSMQQRFYEHSDEVLKKLAWWVQTDPMLNVGVTLRQAGVDIPFTLDATMAGGVNLVDYHIRIRRGSMSRKTDEQRSKELTAYVASVIPVAVQTKMAMAQMGENFDLMAFLKMTANGTIEEEELASVFPGPVTTAPGVAVTMNGPQQQPNNGPGAMRYGIPGTAGQRNGAFTGSSSPNFDTAKNTEKTVSAMGGQG